MKTNETTLKQNVELMAKQEGKTPLEIISMLQSGAVISKNEALLDALCELKWDYIG